MKRSPLRRRTPLRRTRPKQRKAAPPGFDDQVKARVRRRSGNRCEAVTSRCTGSAAHFHHRKLRRHGDHSDVNCLHVCTECHVAIHMHVELAYTMGWLVPSHRDPGEVPVRRHSG